ncbi:hypothetical protein [Kitasatospora cathayae]|uniref:Uncharacterized protein n=1 Tax=Kitasatospora cathayae TaxID=3004092 RepID=A0ABY7QBK7_9ACTN|nr:hypothetical protein [Kitasatospora sp. HUAS 3-15]WBP89496.1 hypothetical protein O1G21_29095 [Kitasatospora sp. HUAS 3-15]
MNKRETYRKYRAELGEHSLVRLQEIVEEISDPNDPRGDDELYVKALHVSLRAVLPSRLPFRTR